MTKKRISPVFIIAAIVLCFGCVFAFTACKSDDSDKLTYRLNEKTDEYAVNGVGEGAVNITIPSKYEGLPVTSISGGAFSNCETLKSVTIPSSVKEIGASAFYGCKSLKTVDFGSGLETIDSHAFYLCESIKEITLPKSLKTVEMGVFRYCYGLKSAKISSGLATLSQVMFDGDTSLKKIYISTSVKTIEAQAFQNCDAITDVYYAGSESKWNKIDIEGGSNSTLTSAKIHYNSDKAK